jgi:glycosyltransferase involved in cell wall biosynthesis
LDDLSIVIPTYNSANTLEKCLDSIDRQSQRASDVVVIDRHSADGTVEIAKAHGARIIQSPAARSAARNLGAKATDSFGVLFVDSDMILRFTLVEECVRLLEFFDSLVVPEASIGRGFWAKCKRIERQNYLGNELIEAPRCFRREPFLAIGGYDENLEAGEDWEMRQRSTRNGFKLSRTRTMLLHDEGEYSLSGAFRRKYAYGRTMRRYLSKNPSASLVQVNPIFRVIDPGVRIMSHDIRHGLGVIILRGVEFAGAASGVLMAGTRNRMEGFNPDHLDKPQVAQEGAELRRNNGQWVKKNLTKSDSPPQER